RFIGQGALPAKPFQTLPRFIPETGIRFTFPFATANCCRIEQRPAACHGKELCQLGFFHCSTEPAAVCILVGLWNSGEGVTHKPAGGNTPVAECSHRPMIGVPRSC